MMKNLALAMSARSIPYIKELRALTDSVNGCILMQQLDFHFASRPNGFYKFTEYCNNPLCKEDETWKFETGFSDKEFRTAFDKIGFRYASKKEFLASNDRFKGKFYCAVHDKRAQYTHYYRNHELVDSAITNLFREVQARRIALAAAESDKSVINPALAAEKSQKSAVTAQVESTVTDQWGVTVSAQAEVTVTDQWEVTVGSQAEVTVTADRAAHEATDGLFIQATNGKSSNTREVRSLEKQLQPVQADVSNRCSSAFDNKILDLIYPSKTLPEEHAALSDLLLACTEQRRQEVLDEIEGNARAGTLRGSVPLCRALVRAVMAKTFTPSLGIAVKASRLAAKRVVDRAEQETKRPEMAWNEMTETELAKLPRIAQKKYYEAKEKREAFSNSSNLACQSS